MSQCRRSTLCPDNLPLAQVGKMLVGDGILRRNSSGETSHDQNWCVNSIQNWELPTRLQLGRYYYLGPLLGRNPFDSAPHPTSASVCVQDFCWFLPISVRFPFPSVSQFSQCRGTWSVADPPVNLSLAHHCWSHIISQSQFKSANLQEEKPAGQGLITHPSWIYTNSYSESRFS